MRSKFSETLLILANEYPIVFLTGDLGFMALELLRDNLGKRFINAGVAEQNMISVAAGLVLSGFQAWVYSIAPFCYARPFEQIRNDICLNKLPVKLVGNGGGYSYGCMGGTHHALEDYGVLAGLQGMHIFIPAFAADIVPITLKMANSRYPNYLRLGRCELPQGFRLPPYQAWRCLSNGEGPLIVVMGPLVGGLLKTFSNMNVASRPEIWVVSEFPLLFDGIPEIFLQKLSQTHALYVVEEHVAQGGVGQNLVWLLNKNGIDIPQFFHFHANGYPSGTYGSQQFHRAQCELNPESIIKTLMGENHLNKFANK